MPDQQRLEDVARAMVKIVGKRGQGVLVGGGLILTAAHCVDFTCEEGMALGDRLYETVETGSESFKASVLAVEPVSDIAVLGPMDSQELPGDADEFERFCEETMPVPVCRAEHARFAPFGIHIYTHAKRWIRGRATLYVETGSTLHLETDERIEGGTSGGPVVNDAGELVAIVSNSSDHEVEGARGDGFAPRPHLALPVWVCRQLFAESAGE